MKNNELLKLLQKGFDTLSDSDVWRDPIRFKASIIFGWFRIHSVSKQKSSHTSFWLVGRRSGSGFGQSNNLAVVDVDVGRVAIRVLCLRSLLRRLPVGVLSERVAELAVARGSDGSWSSWEAAFACSRQSNQCCGPRTFISTSTIINWH